MYRAITLLGLSAALSVAHAGSGTPVDLNGWTAESYPAVSGFGAGVWNVAADNLSVTQTVNGQPTIFYSDIGAFGTDLNGTMTVTGGDDDYAGFVLGFNAGDSTNPNTDYLLVDWKRGTQTFNFGAPSNTPGSTAFRGLAVSRVTGVPTADEFWGHVDFPENPAGGVEELARAATLNDTGWVRGQTYAFTFQFSPNRLIILVDGAVEFDIVAGTDTFSNGRWGFYNFSQASVTYGSFTTSVADSDQDGLLDTDDNCQFVANAAQRDTDGDAIGNFCDPDIAEPNDCLVNFADLNLLKISFFSTPDVGLWNPNADFNGDNAINFGDLQIMKNFFFGAPGPSGLANPCTP